MFKSQVTDRNEVSNECVAVNTLPFMSREEVFISGTPANKIGVVRQMAATSMTPMSLLVLGFKHFSTSFFTDDDSHCYIESLKADQHICAEEYIPKVERSLAKNKAVLFGFTHIDEKPAEETLTAEEVRFLTDFGTKNEHDVYALLITGDMEIAIKYVFEENEFYTLRSTVI